MYLFSFLYCGENVIVVTVARAVNPVSRLQCLWSVCCKSNIMRFPWLPFANECNTLQYCLVSRCFQFSCDLLMESQTGSVTREAPLGISLTLLHSAAHCSSCLHEYQVAMNPTPSTPYTHSTIICAHRHDPAYGQKHAHLQICKDASFMCSYTSSHVCMLWYHYLHTQMDMHTQRDRHAEAHRWGLCLPNVMYGKL